MSFPITPGFISANSTFVENVLEHRFIYDVSKCLLFEQGVLVNMMRSEVDAFGFDFVLSSGKRTVYVQMKTRSKAATGSPYAIADALWKLDNSFVVWMVYNPADLEPLTYYCLDCSLNSVGKFPESKRVGRRAVKMKDVTHKNLKLEALIKILFPSAAAL